jgi:hypothetical protein
MGMRSNSDEFVAVGIALVCILVIAFVLYRPVIQSSKVYQATVVPLSNIMDVGFILFAPAIVLLAGFRAPFFMLGICLLAMAVGFAMAYNIRHYEPIAGQGGPPDRLENTSQWALLGASMVNIAYYTILLVALILLPFNSDTSGRQPLIGAIILAVVLVIGFSGGMDWLNKQGNRTTAFNLAAVIGIVIAFVVFNVQEWLGGRWGLGESQPLEAEDVRKVIGLFAIVQGFEASRYIGVRFAEERRVTTMRLAQVVSTVVFVVFILTLLVIFLPPAGEADHTAIFLASLQVGDSLPWLLLLAAIGSQTSAIIGATSSRSDMLVSRKVPRKYTFPIILGPAILLVLLVDVNVAVNLASRVFAAYFMVQATLAGLLASRKQNWAALAGFVAIGLAMAVVLIFGLPL